MTRIDLSYRISPVSNIDPRDPFTFFLHPSPPFLSAHYSRDATTRTTHALFFMATTHTRTHNPSSFTRHPRYTLVPFFYPYTLIQRTEVQEEVLSAPPGRPSGFFSPFSHFLSYFSSTAIKGRRPSSFLPFFSSSYDLSIVDLDDRDFVHWRSYWRDVVSDDLLSLMCDGKMY